MTKKRRTRRKSAPGNTPTAVGAWRRRSYRTKEQAGPATEFCTGRGALHEDGGSGADADVNAPGNQVAARKKHAGFLAPALLLLAACGGGSGADAAVNAPGNGVAARKKHAGFLAPALLFLAACGGSGADADVNAPGNQVAARKKQAGFLAPLLLFLAACGGGNNGAVQPAPPLLPQPAPPLDLPPGPCEIDTADLGCLSMARYAQERDRIAGRIEALPAYQAHWGYQQTGIARAWAQLQLKHGAARPGAGVRVGIIDDGIRQQHPAFSGAAVSERFYGGAGEASTTFTPEPGGRETASHGTQVASVLIAQGGAGLVGNFIGVAPGVRLHMFTVPSTRDGFLEVWPHYQQIVEQAHRDNVDIFSFSFSSPESIDLFSHRSQLLIGMPGFIDESFIYVAGGGNDPGATSVSAIAGLPVLVPELRDNYIAAVGTDVAGDLRSAPCGSSADWCIAAPVYFSPVAYYGHANEADNGVFPVVETITFSGGTSLAAPYVAGALALIKHAFRDQLSNAEIVQRLYATADKSGPYADRSKYGQGLVDAGAATAPVGRVQVSGGAGPATGLEQAGLRLGAAFGDGLSRRLGNQEIAAFDQLDAPFFLPLADFYRPRPNPPTARFQRPDTSAATPPPRARLQIHDPLPGGDGGYLALSDSVARLRWPGRGNLEATAFASLTRPGQPTLAGAELGWNVAPGLLRLKGGWLAEQNGLLGSRRNNPYSRTNADTFYAVIEAAHAWRGWRLAGRAAAGYTRADVRDSLVRGIDGVVTSAFGLHADRELAAGRRLRLAVQQPVRTEAGRVRLRIPTGRLQDGTRTYRRLSSEATPSGRQLDLTLRVNGEGRPLSRQGTYYYDLALTYSRHPWHSRERGGDLRMQASLGLRY